MNKTQFPMIQKLHKNSHTFSHYFSHPNGFSQRIFPQARDLATNEARKKTRWKWAKPTKTA